MLNNQNLISVWLPKVDVISNEYIVIGSIFFQFPESVLWT